MEAIWTVARRQLGLITRAQALQLVSEDQLRTLVERGHLVRRRRGVYASAGTPPSYEQTVLAGVLAAGDDVLSSHLTAGRMWALRTPAPEAIDLLTPFDRRLDLEGVTHHRTGRITEGDVNRVGPVPVTSVARTLVDCLPFLPGKRFGRAVDDAKRRGLLTYEQLEAAHGFLDRGRKTGRHLVVPGRPVVADRRLAGGSDAELDVLDVLRRAGLPEPVQQHPIVVAGRQRYLDYAYPHKLVYLEYDGFDEHAGIRSVFDDDRDRDSELALLGWLKLGITSNTREADLVRRVVLALARDVEDFRAYDPVILHNPGRMGR